ncbi:hypothetical protein BTVI_44391 [Pitangus sulphuratus]|nr:hypothetical protein BTVI_44391 [Pitangus sulphuratus]
MWTTQQRFGDILQDDSHAFLSSGPNGIPLQQKDRDLQYLSQAYSWDFQRILPSQQDVIDENDTDGDVESPTAGADVAVIGGVIAAVVFVLICLLVVMVRYMYRHKGTYHTNEAKGTEFAESADAALKNDPALQEAVDESKKEYFI